MPKFQKCYYGDCPSDNRIDPKIIFYKFPKDMERCRMWVKNCNNQELNEIWEKSPDKVSTLRICQKHFLPQFLGSSSRLVGHAVPNPMDTEIDPEEFMQTCAGLKCSSGINYTVINGTIQTGYTVNNNGTKTGIGESIVITNPMTAMQAMRIPSNNQPGAHFFVINTGDASVIEGGDSFDAMDTSMSAGNLQNSMTPSTSRQVARSSNGNLVIASPGNALNKKSSTPLVNRNLTSNVTSFQLNGRTLSMMLPNATIDRNHHDQQIQAYKQKVRFYQRKLAVTNHRYQKIKNQVGGRSKKVRLLETLKMCRSDFDPCVFEIFKRQVKGKSKHGNRWSDDVKAFSATIYMRSKAAYKQIRKKIDLPSDSILKRYISESADTLAKYNADDEDDVDSTSSSPTPKENDSKNNAMDVGGVSNNKTVESQSGPDTEQMVAEGTSKDSIDLTHIEASSNLNEMSGHNNGVTIQPSNSQSETNQLASDDKDRGESQKDEHSISKETGSNGNNLALENLDNQKPLETPLTKTGPDEAKGGDSSSQDSAEPSSIAYEVLIES